VQLRKTFFASGSNGLVRGRSFESFNSIKNLSALAAQGQANQELFDFRSSERMYYAKHGPFTLGDRQQMVLLQEG
jgi:dTDP-4-dehydrorhamnose 3,5-epimerase-like enzyme